MSSLARPVSFVAFVVGLAFACTNSIEGLPPEDELAGGGTSAGASIVNGGTTGNGGAMGSASGGAANAAGVGAAPSSGGSGTPGAGGAAGLGGTSAGPIGTGGASTGGSGFAGSAQAGSGAGSFGGRPATGNTTGGSTGIAGSGAMGGSTGVAGSGTPGSAGAPGGASGFAAVTAIITRTCATAMCHGGRRNPNLSAANLYTTLTSTAVSECGNDRLVTAGDTANSAILQLVNGQCGELLMPATCDAPPCLAAADTKTISDWIAAGAPR
jgi:hypothetical protein